MTIEYKKQAIIGGELYDCDLWVSVHETERWSNLLDAARGAQDMPGLESLIKQASAKDINIALSTLEKVYNISCKYEPGLHVGGYPDARSAQFHFPTIPSQEITQIRFKLLENLIKMQVHFDFNKIFFTKNDKRYMEQKLLAEAGSCQSISELVRLYEKYEKSSLLESRRHPYLDRARAGFFSGMGYSALKKNFIDALQSQALNISSGVLSSDDKLILEETLFHIKHTKKGVFRFCKQFNTSVAGLEMHQVVNQLAVS